MPQIEVTFDIDANGIVNVSAKDKATGKEQQIRIQASGGLSDADIERMVKDAESHAEEDKKKRALVEAKNQAEGLINTTERTIRDGGDKVPASEKTALEAAITELREVLTGDDVTAITAKTEALAQLSMKLGEAMYKQAQAAGEAHPGDGGGAGGPGGGGGAGPGAGAAGGKPDDKVVDADFEEVDDQKKHKSA
jgi:molecular chaperone DnaK